MRDLKFELSPWALLVYAVLFFFDDEGVFMPLLLAAAVHESGHAAALILSGARLRSISIGVFMLEIDYSGQLSRGRLLAAALAGPAAGLLLSAVGLSIGGDFMDRCGVISLFLSLFNLIPAMPLDGGRAAALVFPAKTAGKLCKACSFAVLVGGAALLFAGGGLSLAIIACWLVYYNAVV